MHCGSLLLLGGVHDLDFDFKSSKGKLGAQKRVAKYDLLPPLVFSLPFPAKYHIFPLFFSILPLLFFYCDDEDDGAVGCDDDDDDDDVHLDGEAGVDLLELAFARILDVEFDLLPS